MRFHLVDRIKKARLDDLMRSALIGGALLLASCSLIPPTAGRIESVPPPPVLPESQRTVKQTQTGLASFYGQAFHGRITASGEIFNMHRMVAAHPSYPIGTWVRVINLVNERAIEVRVIDRGPTQKYQAEGVIIDLSQGAATKLAMINDGRVRVRVEVLEWGNGQRKQSGAGSSGSIAGGN